MTSSGVKPKTASQYADEVVRSPAGPGRLADVTVVPPTRTDTGSSEPYSVASSVTVAWASQCSAPGRGTRVTVVPDLGPRVDLGRLDRVAAVGVADPPYGRRVRRAGLDVDLVGDQEAGQQPDAELAEEVVPGEAEVVALGTATDRGQKLVDLLLGQPDAGVGDPQRAVAGQFRWLDPDQRRIRWGPRRRRGVGGRKSGWGPRRRRGVGGGKIRVGPAPQGGVGGRQGQGGARAR